MKQIEQSAALYWTNIGWMDGWADGRMDRGRGRGRDGIILNVIGMGVILYLRPYMHNRTSNEAQATKHKHRGTSIEEQEVKKLYTTKYLDRCF
jgi:hypothetical protein